MATTPTRRHFLQSAAGGVLAAATMPTTGLGSAPRFDVVIRGGTIVDGTGSRGSRNDLGIRGDRVAAIGNLADADTKRSVNATGRIVCPGFIDMHSHSDSSLLEDGLAHSAVRQGATTHVIGNCGSSPAPVGSPVRLAGHTLSTYGDFLKALQKNGTSINVCGLVGHNSVRRAVMGTQNRQPTPVELRSNSNRVDVYPYHAGSAGMAQLVPPWAHEGGSGALLGRLKDPVQRRRIARDMVRGTDNWPNFFKIEWDDIQIAAVGNRANRKWVGKRVADVARARKCDGVQACIDLLIEGNGRVRMINFIIDEREMQRVLRHPLSMIGSDGRAVSADTARGMPHPRYYGCFPRVLGRYCRQLKLFPLETAIHKMTAMPARQLSLSDRGTLKVGQAADVVVFNFQTIIDKATFQAPHQYPEGIDAVFVNGLPVVLDGGHTETRPGRILRPQRS